MIVDPLVGPTRNKPPCSSADLYIGTHWGNHIEVYVFNLSLHATWSLCRWWQIVCGLCITRQLIPNPPLCYCRGNEASTRFIHFHPTSNHWWRKIMDRDKASLLPPSVYSLHTPYYQTGHWFEFQNYSFVSHESDDTFPHLLNRFSITHFVTHPFTALCVV